MSNDAEKALESAIGEYIQKVAPYAHVADFEMGWKRCKEWHTQQAQTGPRYKAQYYYKSPGKLGGDGWYDEGTGPYSALKPRANHEHIAWQFVPVPTASAAVPEVDIQGLLHVADAIDIPSHKKIVLSAYDVLKALTAAPAAVPEGFKVWRDDDGNFRLDDIETDEHILMPEYFLRRADLWGRVVARFMRAMLAASPAPGELHKAVNDTFQNGVGVVRTEHVPADDLYKKDQPGASTTAVDDQFGGER